jgi:hypothetical protein
MCRNSSGMLFVNGKPPAASLQLLTSANATALLFCLGYILNLFSRCQLLKNTRGWFPDELLLLLW